MNSPNTTAKNGTQQHDSAARSLFGAVGGRISSSVNLQTDLHIRNVIVVVVGIIILEGIRFLGIVK